MTTVPCRTTVCVGTRREVSGFLMSGIGEYVGYHQIGGVFRADFYGGKLAIVSDSGKFSLLDFSDMFSSADRGLIDF